MYNGSRDYPLYKLPKIKNLCGMMVQKTQTQPDSIAFAWFEGDSLIKVTYREFEKDVCKTVMNLRQAGLQKANIGIMGKNSYKWLVLYMAILCSGNTAVPLDRDMEADEFRDVLQRMEIRRVFIDTTCSGKAGFEDHEMGAPIFVHYNDQYNKADPFFDQEWNDEVFSCVELVSDLNDNSTACIFLTSGTTGKRKGVMLSHANIAADINGSCQLFELKGDTLAILPFHHAFGLIVAVWMVFHYGHTVYISQGFRRIKKELPLVKPQTMLLVPAFVESFYKMVVMSIGKKSAVTELPNRADKAFFGGKLEYIICGGAALDKQYIQKNREFGVEILNGYGTTECSPVAAANRNFYHKDGTVGLPLPDTQVTVSEESEILIAGGHVMKGYYNDLAETAEALRDGWYRTGDLGVIDDDGFITLTGRKNNLILLSSGENISPEELEEKLLRLKGIEEVVVCAREGKLTAEIYAGIGCDEVRESIKTKINELNTTLPMYKRIAVIHFREMPFEKTTSQKIIRRFN